MNILRRGWQENFVVAGDIAIIALSYTAAYFIRFDGVPEAKYLEMLVSTLPLVVVVRIAALFYFKLTTSMWRYASMKDLTQIIKAVTASSVIIVAITMVTSVGHPRAIFIIDWLLLVIGLSGTRFVIRLTRPIRWGYRNNGKNAKRKKLLIVGAGDAAELVLREMIERRSHEYNVVGMVDDDPKKLRRTIHGIPVLGKREDITDIVNKYGVEEIIIAMPSATGEEIRKIIFYCKLSDVKMKIVPGLQKIISGEVEIKLRDVRPEDLLGRETVRIREDEVKAFIKGKSVLVTGAAGSIGGELVRQISSYSPGTVILLDHNENDLYFLQKELEKSRPDMSYTRVIGDIKDIGLLKNTFSKYRPDIVFHAAAHKHVPLMEENPSAAVKNNIIGSRNLMYASEHYGVKSFVLISSDKAVNPTSIMGVTKRISEIIMQAKAKSSRTKFMAVRFGNVLGSKGSVVPLFRKQIEDGGPVTVTHPETKRFFMSITEAVQLVLQASASGKGGEIFILDMGEQIKIVDLARNLIVLSGFVPDKDIEIKFTGLRPGEKLYEETLRDSEKDKATKYDKIFIAQPDSFDPRKLRAQIKELERLARIMDVRAMTRKLKEIAPSYSPKE